MNSVMSIELFKSRFQVSIESGDLVFVSEYVCSAYDNALGRPVELILLSYPLPEELIQKLKDLSSPYVQKVFSSIYLEVPERQHPILVIVLESVNSININQFIKTFPDEAVIYKVVGGLLNGISDIHQSGLVVSSFFPAHVWVYQNHLHEEACMISALALIHPDRFLNETDTSGNIRQNTAPEVILPPHIASYQSDVWSVGSLLFEVLTGEYPLVSYEHLDFTSHFDALAGTIREPYQSIIRASLKINPEHRAKMEYLIDVYHSYGTTLGKTI